MQPRRFLQLDVFSDTVGKGNALAVVLDASGMDAIAMQRFAAWMNLSETAFLLPTTDPRADYRVRIFTPRQELPFAGHPSVGSAYAALHSGLVQARDGVLLQECAAGLLPLRIETNGSHRRVHVRAPRASMRRANSAECDALAGMFPLAGRESLARSRVVDNGPSWWIVPFDESHAVRELAPALAAMGSFCAASDCVGLAVYAHADAPDHQLVVRAFCPNDSIPEDPVTGSANAAIAAVLEVDGGLARSGNPYIASQGRELGRDGVVHVAVDDQHEVWIGGDCVVAISGELSWT